MHFVIALSVDSLIHNIARKIAFDAINLGLDNESLFMMPHISLKQSFPYNEPVEDLEAFFDDFFRNVEPFRIQTGCISLVKLSPENGLLWYEVVENQTLRALHNELNIKLKNQFGIEPAGFDGSTWHFHTTIVYSKSGFDKLEALYLKHRDSCDLRSYMAKEAILFCQPVDRNQLKGVFSYKLTALGKQEGQK